MNEKTGLFSQLVALAKADEKITEQEQAFLLELAHLLQISKDDFDKVVFGESPLYTPKSEFDRILQFYRLFLLARIDRELSEQEIIFLKNTGLKFGLRPDAIHEVINEVKNNTDTVIPEQTLINIFTKHYN